MPDAWVHYGFDAQSFAEKMDSEGGPHAFLDWGGEDAFPPELRHEAREYRLATERLRGALRGYFAANGVEDAF